MIESRCGILSSSCGYKDSRGCKGCVNIDNPFWGECDVKKCCEGKKLEHCGQCESFVCDTLHSFAYAEKEGDNGKRIEQCKAWSEEENRTKSGV